MPEQNYSEYKSNQNSYSANYRQYYVKNTNNVKVKPIRKVKRKKKSTSLLKKIISLTFFATLLFYVLPYSFKNFIVDVFPYNEAKIYNVDYQKLLYPTHNYLYKDLFLGKFIIKNSKITEPKMVDIKQTYERIALKNALIDLAHQYPKIQPSVYVWEYKNGTYVDINADKIYPAASIIKIPVLIEMFKEIENGKFGLYDKMVMQDYFRAPGSGKLQYSQGGIAHTMDYLAKIMIENSDNSSTNMIMAKMGGMPQVNKAIRSWGLNSTHINNWLPDLDGTNVTTAKELAKMLYNIDTTDILSADSKLHISDYLSHVKNNRLLQAGLPPEAILLHKTGDIGFMLGDAGIVKSPNGRKYIVVILAKRPYNNLQGKEFIVNASTIIYNHISN